MRNVTEKYVWYYGSCHSHSMLKLNLSWTSSTVGHWVSVSSVDLPATIVVVGKSMPRTPPRAPPIAPTKADLPTMVVVTWYWSHSHRAASSLVPRSQPAVQANTTSRPPRQKLGERGIPKGTKIFIHNLWWNNHFQIKERNINIIFHIPCLFHSFCLWYDLCL